MIQKHRKVHVPQTLDLVWEQAIFVVVAEQPLKGKT
jgi:hypothetical protein